MNSTTDTRTVEARAAMPALGYWLGSHFQKQIESVDPWIAFVLLCLIGINMIHESCGEAIKRYASIST